MPVPEARAYFVKTAGFDLPAQDTMDRGRHITAGIEAAKAVFLDGFF